MIPREYAYSHGTGDDDSPPLRYVVFSKSYGDHVSDAWRHQKINSASSVKNISQDFFSIVSIPVEKPVILSRSHSSFSDVTDFAKNALARITAWEKDDKGRMASFFAVYYVEQCFFHRSYEQLNTLLIEAKAMDQLTEWSMIALLRSSFSARQYLPAWSMFLGSVHDRLVERNKDPVRLLRGLNR